MSKMVSSARFTGVYYRESTKRKHRGKPDRTWWIAYPNPDHTTAWLKIGKASEGVTAAYASQRRDKILNGSAPHPDANHLTVSDAVRSYALWRQAEGKDFRRDLDRYNLHMADVFGALPISSITPAMLTTHKARLTSLGTLGPQSILHIFGFVRAAIYHALANGEYAGLNPFRSDRRGRFRLTPPDNARFRWFTRAEAEHVLCGLRGSQVYEMSLLALHTGMRASEVISTLGSGLDPESGLVWFRAKNGRTQSVPVEPWLMDTLLALGRSPGDPLFPARDGGPLRHGIPSAWARCIRDLGLNDGVEPALRVTFHVWRHTFASWLAQSGRVTLQELQEIMRHERVEMTLRYAHLLPGHHRRASSIISERLGRTAPVPEGPAPQPQQPESDRPPSRPVPTRKND